MQYLAGLVRSKSALARTSAFLANHEKKLLLKAFGLSEQPCFISLAKSINKIMHFLGFGV